MPTPPPTSGGLSGVVSNSDGPVENAVVALCPANGDPCQGDDTNRDQTDADGTYLIENVTGGTYRVNIYLPELDFQRRALDTVEIDATVRTRDFPLPAGSVDGTITHADGSAAQSVTVQVCGPIPTEDRFLWDCHAVTVQSDGSYELPYLIPGEWEFMLFFPSPVHENPRGYGQVSVLEAPVTRNVVLPAGSVAGTVELPDGAPAAGSTVSLCGGELSACIGGNTLDGAFNLKYLEPGEYTLTANPPYGRDDLRSVSTRVTVAVDPVSVDVRLAVGASLSGRILNADGDVLTGADVVGVAVMEADMSSGWTAYFDAGEFTIQLEEDGVYAIVVYTQPDSLYDTTTVHNVSVTGPTTRDVVLDLRPTGGVTGTVYDSTGTDPQPYHELWLCTEAQSGSCNWFTQSDGTGGFTFRFIPPGDYQVAAVDPFTGQLTSIGDVTIGDGIVQRDFNLPAGPTGGLTGRILNSEGSPVAGVEVTACIENCFSSVTTGDDGRYELSGLPAGEYAVYVSPPQPYAFTWFTQTIGSVVVERDVTLDPVPSGGLAGYIRTNDGAAAPDVYVTACNPNGACFQTPSGWDGAYQLLGLPAGWYRITLYEPTGVSTEVADPIYVADAVVEIDFDLPPVPTGGITGTVFTAAGTLEYPQLYACGPSNCHWATSDVAGNYSFTSLAPGQYSLHLAIESSWRTVGSVAVASDVVMHDVTLPTGELSGYVRDSADGASPVPNSWVQACDQAGNCYGAYADESGHWTISYLPSGAYRLTAYPGSGEFLATTLDGTTAVDGNAVSVNILLGRITPAPETVTMTGSGSIGSSNGVPVLLAGPPIELRVEACADATAASYEITSLYYSQSVSGTMTEDPAGSQVFTASVVLTFGGAGEVVITIAGCDPIEFNVYIDPSGWVYDTLGVPIVGADVVLLRSASADGPFEVVPDGSAIMSPSNRTNPDVTDEVGHFGWDVTAGFYKVQTSKPGCVSAADPSLYWAETRVYAIPPPVMDIDLRLNCGETSTVPGTDTVDPTITIGSPSEGATLILGSDISFGCTDNVGIASCVATVDGVEITSTAAATASVGQHTLVVTATDSSGNTASVERTYQVVYDFDGFFRPVDVAAAGATPIFNRLKAGAGVPVKFTLGGDQGLDVFETGSPSSAKVPCDPSATVDAVEETVTTKGSHLTYDSATGQYIYTFKTDKQWAGTCRVLTLRLDDGTVHRAYFTFP